MRRRISSRARGEEMSLEVGATSFIDGCAIGGDEASIGRDGAAIGHDGASIGGDDVTIGSDE
jgi:hypothetical protein